MRNKRLAAGTDAQPAKRRRRLELPPLTRPAPREPVLPGETFYTTLPSMSDSALTSYYSLGSRNEISIRDLYWVSGLEYYTERWVSWGEETYSMLDLLLLGRLTRVQALRRVAAFVAAEHGGLYLLEEEHDIPSAVVGLVEE
eukprot:g32794.t1